MPPCASPLVYPTIREQLEFWTGLRPPPPTWQYGSQAGSCDPPVWIRTSTQRTICAWLQETVPSISVLRNRMEMPPRRSSSRLLRSHLSPIILTALCRRTRITRMGRERSESDIERESTTCSDDQNQTGKQPRPAGNCQTGASRRRR